MSGRRPSGAMVVSSLALFIALGGAGLAANGQGLILGSTTNSATAKTVLAAPVNDKALQLTNTSTGTSATALGLTVASGRPPLTVSSGAGKVVNLNGDLLDGIDSTGFWKTSGNGGTTPGTNFLGTTDGKSLIVQPGTGSVDVGGTTSPSPTAKLAVLSGSFWTGVSASGVTGVQGISPTDEVGIGVLGAARASSGNTVGVYGIANSREGVGVRADAVRGGWAMLARGSVAQDTDVGGWVKALVRVYGNGLSRCFRGDVDSNGDTTSCAPPWAITGSGGATTVTFPFQVDQRYVVVTPEYAAATPITASYDFPAPNQVRVRTWTCGTGGVYMPCTPIPSAYSLAVL